MKSKAMPHIPTSSRAILYPVLSFGLILAWLFSKMQIERILHGGHELVLYPLLVIAGFPETWFVALILGCIMVYAHIRGMRHLLDESRYNALGFGSGLLQGAMLLYSVIFTPIPMSVVHVQSLANEGSLYHFTKGEVVAIGGFFLYSVMECDPFGLVCMSNQASLQVRVCDTEAASLALDPETHTPVIRIGSETYPLFANEERNHCVPEHGLKR